MYRLQRAKSGEPSESDFLALPAQLYDRRYLVQNLETEQALIAGAHPLSHYIRFHAYVVYRSDVPVARFALTYYTDRIVYIGFFECEPQKDTASFLFAQVDTLAKKHQAQQIIGPVNASFWLQYRLKTNHFDKPPYVGEPYNLDYYESQFADNGYVVRDRYISTIYSHILSKRRFDEFRHKHQVFKKKHYEMIGISYKNFDKHIDDFYAMVMKLYADFPVFHPITKDEFRTIFAPMKHLVVPSFAKIAYHHGKPAGFLFGLPDYQTLLTNPTGINKLTIVLKKLRAPRYVMLYMGVLPEHTGLARALLKTTIVSLYLRLAPLVGALIHEGKVTGSYAHESIDDTYTYVLLTKKVGE